MLQRDSFNPGATLWNNGTDDTYLEFFLMSYAPLEEEASSRKKQRYAYNPGTFAVFSNGTDKDLSKASEMKKFLSQLSHASNIALSNSKVVKFSDSKDFNAAIQDRRLVDERIQVIK